MNKYATLANHFYNYSDDDHDDPLLAGNPDHERYEELHNEIMGFLEKTTWQELGLKESLIPPATPYRFARAKWDQHGMDRRRDKGAGYMVGISRWQYGNLRRKLRLLVRKKLERTILVAKYNHNQVPVVSE